MNTRRWLLSGLIACLALGGCGFRPLYAAHGAKGYRAADSLAAVSVAIIPNRSGQLLRQALQQRLDGTQTGQLRTFELTVAYGIASEAIGVQRDSTFTRLRETGIATWTLKSLGEKPTVLAAGLSRALDGANVIDQQYFAADIESETAQARIAENIADQITTQLAAYFVRQDAVPRQ